MFLSDKTSEALDELVGACFDMNRTMDRMCSVMQNVFTMPQATDIIHHKLAHLWPLLADEISGFKDQYNVLTYYPETHGDNRMYTNMLDLTETMLKETGEVYQMVKMTYGIAKDEGDLNACAMLMRFTRLISIVMSQIITLRDKAKEMPTDYDSYDAHIDDWGIDGVDLTNIHMGSDD